MEEFIQTFVRLINQAEGTLKTKDQQTDSNLNAEIQRLLKKEMIKRLSGGDYETGKLLGKILKLKKEFRYLGVKCIIPVQDSTGEYEYMPDNNIFYVPLHDNNILNSSLLATWKQNGEQVPDQFGEKEWGKYIKEQLTKIVNL